MKRFLFVATMILLCGSVFAQIKSEGTYEGMQWQIAGEGYKEERCLIVNGKTVLNDKHSIQPKEIGGKLFFEAQRRIGKNNTELFSIKGDRVIPYKYDWLEFPKDKKGWDYVKVVRVENEPDLLYTVDLKLLHSNVSSSSPIVKTFEGINEKFLEVLLQDEKGKLIYALYNTDWKLIVPIYKYFYLSGEYFQFESPNGFKGRLDKSFQWIGPSATVAQQFERVEELPDENNTKHIPTKYYRCKKGGYWGLYDSNYKEIIAPDYEDLSYFENTNFIKFKLNGFWGIMSIQGNTAKTIIPSTRGYTNISRYVKSLKRFTYEMAGWKGECDAITGRQLSKIKVEVPKQQIVKQEPQPNPKDDKDTIIIKHDPIPMQVWKQCEICLGSGKCQACANIVWGSGSSRECLGCGWSRKCQWCAGQGGHYEVEYR